MMISRFCNKKTWPVALVVGLTTFPRLVMQPALTRLVCHIAHKRPELFDRLGPHKDAIFLLDPTNMPFVLLLSPHPDRPALQVCSRRRRPDFTVRIAGKFLALLAMIDDQVDGDALFFRREIVVEGDTEALVCLRNALDDVEGSIAEDVASFFGRPGHKLLAGLRRIGGGSLE